MATVQAFTSGPRILTEISSEAQALHRKAGFGTLLPDGRLELNGFEALFLFETERIVVMDGRGRQSPHKAIERRVVNTRRKWVQYRVFADMRKRGYTVKTALKFGADFRVYERGTLPGDDHAKWVLFAVHEHDALTWHGFAAKSRVAHATKKRLLIGAVDDEGDVTYWDVGWVRP